MQISLPRIIQGGMGAGVSNWRLAKAVSCLGELGVVSGTALDQILARRLQDGDPGGNVTRALAHFPYPRMAQRIIDALFVPGGREDDAPYSSIGMHALEGRRWLQELCIAANFVEVFLAREGHSNPVGINYLEKIQLPHLPSMYGAMLAGVAVVIVGAGIPTEIPAAMDALADHKAATYPISVTGAPKGTSYLAKFNPDDFADDRVAELEPLARPDFVPIVSSDTLASMLLRRAGGAVAGFVIEGNRAGGHNTPPRGKMLLTEEGEPIYGPRDIPDLEGLRKLGLPFWLAGSYGSPERLQDALQAGAAGIQVGTAFALCAESGLDPTVRQALVRKALTGKASVFTDPYASPTGFPFKVAKLEDTLSEMDVYGDRQRVCDLGFLREAYLKADGTVGYRCPAEPESTYLAKGGKAEAVMGRKCLCNALMANIGLAQRLGSGGQERCLVTMGDDAVDIERFCVPGTTEYTAADVVRVLLGSA